MMGAIHRKTGAWRHVHRALCILIASCPIASIAQDVDPSLGSNVYANNCAACHQPTGEGIPGAFPALKGSPLVLGEISSLLQVILAGRGGMPTFNASLTDNQVAAVATYIRNEWGNHAEPVSSEQAHEVSSSIDAVADEGGRGN